MATIKTDKHEAIVLSSQSEKDLQKQFVESGTFQTVTGRSGAAGRPASGFVSRFGSLAFLRIGGDGEINQVVIDQDRREMPRTAPGAFGMIKQPVVNQDIAIDLLDLLSNSSCDLIEAG